jgi:hypothetical protein
MLCCADRSRGFQKFHVTQLACPARNRHGTNERAGHRPCDFCFEPTRGRAFLMFRTGSLQRQEPWTPFVIASAALAFALYYLHTHNSTPSSASKAAQVNEQSCQASDAAHGLDTMDAEERAYHERFMREAIAMVNRLLHVLRRTWLTHHPVRLSLP